MSDRVPCSPLRRFRRCARFFSIVGAGTFVGCAGPTSQPAPVPVASREVAGSAASASDDSTPLSFAWPTGQLQVRGIVRMEYQRASGPLETLDASVGYVVTTRREQTGHLVTIEDVAIEPKGDSTYLRAELARSNAWIESEPAFVVDAQGRFVDARDVAELAASAAAAVRAHPPLPPGPELDAIVAQFTPEYMRTQIDALWSSWVANAIGLGPATEPRALSGPVVLLGGSVAAQGTASWGGLQPCGQDEPCALVRSLVELDPDALRERIQRRLTATGSTAVIEAFQMRFSSDALLARSTMLPVHIVTSTDRQFEIADGGDRGTFKESTRTDLAFE
mgnify:CR=1 FL=1